MRKRFVYMSAVLSTLFFCSFCDPEKCSKPGEVKKVAITRHVTTRPVDITTFFLFN